MRRKVVRFLVVTLLLLAAVFLVSVYRSYIDQVPITKAFDSVATTILNSVWGLIQDPVVFTVLAICVALWIFRDRLSAILPMLTEVQAGAFSAKIDASKLAITESAARTRSERTKLKESPSKGTLAAVVDSLSTEACWILLKVANREISYVEYWTIISSEMGPGNWPWREGNPNVTAAYTYSLGLDNLEGLLYETQVGSADNTVIHRIPLEVIQLIEQKLEISRQASSQA